MHHEKCVNFHKVSCVSAANIASFQVLTIQSESILCHNKNVTTISVSPNNASFICRSSEDTEAASCFYKTWTFWGFVLLTFTGTVFFNVGNSISDAICFDVLGEEKQSKYGKQRVWGSIGFGIASLLAGYAVDLHTNDFTPAVLILMAFASIDLLVLSRLNLPKPTPSESIFKDVGKLLRHRKIVIFLVFATIVGMFDSFIFYYMFWHLEEVAERTHMKDHIKLIEGITVAAECIFGEVLFFMISGKIIKKLGYIHCMSFCLLCYAMRLFMISLIPNPWYLIGIEILMQGCTYALCYTCIVCKFLIFDNFWSIFSIIFIAAYASVISPTGTSATVQGLVAGMDDGLGFSIGALFGGFLYQSLGGQQSFKVFALIALVTFIAHVILRPSSTHELKAPAKLQQTDSISPNPQDSKEAAQENSKLTEDC